MITAAKDRAEILKSCFEYGWDQAIEVLGGESEADGVDVLFMSYRTTDWGEKLYRKEVESSCRLVVCHRCETVESMVEVGEFGTMVLQESCVLVFSWT